MDAEPDDDAGIDPELAAAEPLTLPQARERLAPFIAANPQSDIEEFTGRAGTRLAIVRPWGDPALRLTIPHEIGPFAEAMNQLILPERFSAIWHRDTSDLEIIYTSFRLRDEEKDLVDRKFVFRYLEQEYVCEFAPSSERLLRIAEYATPISESVSNHRNLMSFIMYDDNRKSLATGGEALPIPLGDPICFWVRNVKSNQDDILGLTTHLNFYMTLYDASSPTIIIHTPMPESVKAQPQTRYRVGRFPAQIDAHNIDDILLHFWAASLSGDPARRFLYSYRVIEYVSFSYLEAEIRAAVRRFLLSPHMRDDPDKTIDSVVSAVAATKLHDAQKFDAVIHDMVDPAALWREMNQNITMFSTEYVFDGGFTIPPLARTPWKEEDFGTNGVGQFARAVRDIRNALSHGKDQRTGSVITPTALNFRKLQPWASLLAVAAGDVLMNYRR